MLVCSEVVVLFPILFCSVPSEFHLLPVFFTRLKSFHHHFRSNQRSIVLFSAIILADLFSELARYYHLNESELDPVTWSFPNSPPPHTSVTPTNMAYQPTSPTFSFCGTFSGTGTVSAARWLKRLDHEFSGYKIDGVVKPFTYLDSLNMLLTDDAAEWAESHPDAIRLLAIEDPTAQDLENFKSLLCERFPTRSVEVSPIPFDAELAELHQRPDEALSSFYKRVTSLMQRVGAKDRPAPNSSTTLTLLESAMLDTILRAFLKGIRDHAVRREATRGMAAADRSLKSVYNLAEEARRTNLEIQKIYEEEVKSKQFTFYKDLAERNMSKNQIDALTG